MIKEPLRMTNSVILATKLMRFNLIFLIFYTPQRRKAHRTHEASIRANRYSDPRPSRRVGFSFILPLLLIIIIIITKLLLLQLVIIIIIIIIPTTAKSTKITKMI